jgi:NAD(P)-dependent dehydrogenase (short-subunit alcohol dehydrogenase family)
MKKTALVTGGARGIGFGCSEALAKAGFGLLVAGRRAEQDCADALAELRAHGGRVEYAVCDVADPTQRAALVAFAKEKFGALNVLVNNAGIAPRERADILEAKPEIFDEVLETNLKGPYFLTQAVANWMVERKRADPASLGVIVNVSSVSATVASVNRGEYCISKAGVAMATQLWAARLAEFGINVFEVRPGIVATDMTSGVKAKYDALIASGGIPLKRWGQPEDIGAAVAALASGAFAYATGQAFVIDGGMTVQKL